MIPADLVVAALGFLVWTIKVTIHRTQIAGPRVAALYDLLLAGLWTNIVQGQRTCHSTETGIGILQETLRRGEGLHGDNVTAVPTQMSVFFAILSMWVVTTRLAMVKLLIDFT